MRRTPIALRENRRPDPVRVARAVIEMYLGATFHEAVEQPFILHDLTRADIECILREGLEKHNNDLKLTLKSYNVPDKQMDRTLKFLCHFGFFATKAVS